MGITWLVMHALARRSASQSAHPDRDSPRRRHSLRELKPTCLWSALIPRLSLYSDPHFRSYGRQKSIFTLRPGTSAVWACPRRGVIICKSMVTCNQGVRPTL